ncbi:MAG: hypothetical protein R3E77_11935 [Steroidobacteraceae bacterium]
MNAAFVIYGCLQCALLIWLLRYFRRSRDPAALVLMVPQALLVYDNWVIAAGAWIGPGPTLLALSWPRFWGHWLFGSWLVLACGAILQRCGFARGHGRPFTGTFGLLTLALMACEAPHFWNVEIHAVCEPGVIRYSSAVRAGTSCFDPWLVVAGGPPLVPIIVCLVVIGCGIAVSCRCRSFWLMAGGILMLISASPPLAAAHLDNLGEVCIMAGFAATLESLSCAVRAATR